MKRAVFLLGVLVAMGAGAYVLPGGAIMRRMVAAREDVQFSALKADGSLHFYGPAVKEAGAALGLPTDRPELEADGSVYLKVPGRCRFEAKAREGNTVASVMSGGRKRVEGSEIPALSEAVQQVCALLASRWESAVEGREAVETYLRSLGIEPRTTSLARFGGDVVYVLGQQGEGKPQFWVYKEGFRPARLRYKDAKGTAWDVRFLDYTSPATGEMLPRSIEVWRGDERVMRFTVLTGDTRAKIADTLL
ncbi:hypothetical protein [Vitiosangium sp. GDMCC 1.1324]|uniref:hypothetical protein n=1 Tax=Vitiosangium sp. (strain GDMCC 1.1324) TaxID=2138576 RepID=UPI000D3A5C5A|nr:hypothetical protein [Vitiosangium sp. GDMCC 1.1324]PTL79053.1 hypothetical protein DAT35_36175 [Vitiosangium sp. GDMCC 1.1324]